MRSSIDRFRDDSSSRSQEVTGSADVDAFHDPGSDVSISVALVESHELARRGLELMLDSLPDVEVVCSAPGPDVALTEEHELHPDILMAAADLGVKKVCDLVEAAGTQTHLLVLIRSGEPRYLEAAIKLPATGFLLEQNLTLQVLRDTLRRVRQGVTTIPNALGSHLLARGRTGLTWVLGKPRLTPRERQVIELLVEGMTNKEISKTLMISGNSVKRHVATVIAKLNCGNRTEVVARALRQGLILEV